MQYRSVQAEDSANGVRSRASLVLVVTGLAAVCQIAGVLFAAEPGATASTPSATPAEPRSAAALKSALNTNLNYCDDWLKSNDFKTLGQTAAGIELVVDALAAQSLSPEWQASLVTITAGANALEAAARAKNPVGCREQIALLRGLIARLPKLTEPPPAASPRKPASSMREMMSLLEGTLADAKTAAAVGSGDEARTHALVLAELGRVMSNYRKDAGWQKWNNDFIAASQAAADAPLDQPAPTYRALLKTVSQRCDACHDKR